MNLLLKEMMYTFQYNKQVKYGLSLLSGKDIYLISHLVKKKIRRLSAAVVFFLVFVFRQSKVALSSVKWGVKALFAVFGIFSQPVKELLQ